MTQKHKESDLEQVKSLLRRLEDIPEPQAASGQPGTPMGRTPEPRKPTQDAIAKVVGIAPTPPHRAATQDPAPFVRAEPIIPRPYREAPSTPPMGPIPPQNNASPQAPAPSKGNVHQLPQDDRKPKSIRVRRGLLVGAALIVAGSAASVLVWPTVVPTMMAATGLLKGPARSARPEMPARDARPATAAVVERTSEPVARATPTPTKVEPSAPAAETSNTVTAASPTTPSPMTPSPMAAAPAAVPATFEPSPNAVPAATAATPAIATAALPEPASANASGGSPTAALPPVDAGRPGGSTTVLAPVALAPAAPPPKRAALPEAENPDEELQRKLVLQGQQMLTQGHVASARLLFRRAADTGSAEAAILLGDTFDPQRLYSLGVRGVAGDLQQSIRWYEKADELGASDAKERLMSVAGR